MRVKVKFRLGSFGNFGFLAGVAAVEGRGDVVEGGDGGGVEFECGCRECGGVLWGEVCFCGHFLSLRFQDIERICGESVGIGEVVEKVGDLGGRWAGTGK